MINKIIMKKIPAYISLVLLLILALIPLMGIIFFSWIDKNVSVFIVSKPSTTTSITTTGKKTRIELKDYQIYITVLLCIIEICYVLFIRRIFQLLLIIKKNYRRNQRLRREFLPLPPPPPLPTPSPTPESNKPFVA
jgi:hypothetical protein